MIKNESEAERATIHVELEIQEGMKYRAGDHLVICPEIPQEVIDKFLSMFVDYDGDSVVQWVGHGNGNGIGSDFTMRIPVNVPLCLGNLLRNCLDIKCTPSNQFLANLRPLVQSEEHDKFLKTLTTSSEAYKAWLERNQPLSIVDAVEMFPIKPERFGRLLEIIPLLKPRPYSISSSYLADPKSVHVTIGVVADSFPNKKKYHGVCSHYLFTKLPEISISTRMMANVYVEAADDSFAVPEDDSLPLILISAGTGFAPMRSFIHERHARKAKGPIYVFFGCRNEEQDVLYDEELCAFEEQGLISARWTAYSRSQRHPSEYVQGKILQQKKLIWNVIDKQRGHLYVCGSASRVAAGVRDSLLQIIMELNSCDLESAECYLATLECQHRYEQDVWG